MIDRTQEFLLATVEAEARARECTTAVNRQYERLNKAEDRIKVLEDTLDEILLFLSKEMLS